ncbi:MAG: hypothetical protein WCS52_01950 [bacterium]
MKMKKIISLAIIAAIIAFAVPAFAVNTVTNYTGSRTVFSSHDLGKIYVVENTVSFGAGAGSGDIYKCIGVPKGAAVLAVSAEVLTASSNPTAAFGIGDSGSITQYVGSTAATNVAITAAAYTTQKQYTSAADDIRLTTTAVCTGGTVRVRAVIADLSK